MAADSLNTAPVDARPTIPAAAQSPWAEAGRLRDGFAATLEQVTAEHGLRVLVSKSQPGVYPISVQMIAWTPIQSTDQAAVTRREDLTISIEVNPYLEHPLTFVIDVRTRTRRTKKQRWRMDEDDVRALALFALGAGGRPAILGGDMLRAILLAIPIVNLFVDRNRLIKSARPTLLTWPKTLGVVGLLAFLVGGGMAELAPEAAPLATILGAALLAAAAIWAGRRPIAYSSVKRPDLAPRALYLVDSWHSCLPNIGASFNELVIRVQRAVSNLDPTIETAWEIHQHRTPYGFEDRQRLTLTKGQAVVHVHIYPFADDAFVGWDGFLNWARWAETEPVSVCIRDGRRLENRSLTVAGHIPNEFDLVEFNALSELVHRRIVVELKALLKEKSIEADIDFTIIRGDRDNALSAGERADKRKRRSWLDVTRASAGGGAR